MQAQKTKNANILRAPKPYLIDSHTHLLYCQKHTPLQKILHNAERNNIKGLLNISVTMDEILPLEEMSSLYNNINHTVGIHPCYAHHYTLNAIDEYLKQYVEKSVAIGESGLDLYHVKSNWCQDMWHHQVDSLFLHAQYAAMYSKPLILHMRNADESGMRVLSCIDWSKITPILHCCSSSIEFVDFMLSRGAYVSFSGNITQKRMDRLIKFVPLEKILVETDSPFLVPNQYKKQGAKTNEPSYIIETVQYIASVKQISFDQLCLQSSVNFHKAVPSFNLDINKSFMI